MQKPQADLCLAVLNIVGKRLELQEQGSRMMTESLGAQGEMAKGCGTEHLSEEGTLEMRP